MRDQLQRLKAALSGRYEIERELGAGGMASVYLALDSKHDRKVAVKVLRDELSAVIGADRFLSEIRTTAPLQHPHILPLFDSGEADGLLFFVMPYVEGNTLADRLVREKQLPIDDAVRIASETAEALDHAHRHGVIHRDVKPANILLYEGRALVADFGIALAVSEASDGRVTETGLSLGTPQYMSPEQAAGERSLDARTDVFALGCVLYEMLAGEPPHDGPNAQAILARVLTAEARPVTEIRKTVPPHIAVAVDTALQKLPADRFATAKDFARALGDSSATSSRMLPISGRGSPSLLQRTSLGLNAVLGAALLGLGIYAFDGMSGEQVRPSPWVTRTSLSIDPTTLLGEPTVSPDGRLVGWAASDGIHVRSLDDLNDRVIPGTSGALKPRFSYGGTRVAFEFENELRVVPINGGPQRVLAKVAAWPSLSDRVAAGPVWNDQGWVYFVNLPNVTFMQGKRWPGTPVMKVSDEGGTVREVLPADSMRTFGPRSSLPGAHAVLGTTFKPRPSSAFGPSSPSDNDLQIGVLDEKRGSIVELLQGRAPAYERQTSHILFLRGSTLMAAKFSIRRLKVTDAPFPVEENVGAFGLAGDGTLWSVRGSTTRQIPVSIDRNGTAREIFPQLKDEDRFGEAYFSPDGNHLALALTPPGKDTADAWVYTPSTGNLRRLTYEGARFPTWSLDGTSILFVGPQGVYEVKADGSSPAELIVRDKNIGFLQSAPGGWIVFERTNGTDLDVGIALRSSGDSVQIIVGGKSNQEDPAVSPDGRWLAYESDETGQREVYVVPFRSATRAHRVSVAGGNNPFWSQDGRELFFRNGSNVFEAVSYRSTPQFRVLGRTELFNAQQYAGRFHPSPDGSRFLASRSGGPRADAHFVLTRNWVRVLIAKSEEARRQAGNKAR